MRYVVAAGVLLALTGCNAKRETPPDPVGRYQIVNGTGTNLFIADTRDGKLWRCTYATPDAETHCARIMDLKP